MKEERIKKMVQEGYAKVAKTETSCCGQSATCSCTAENSEEISMNIGYSEGEISSVPEGANLGLGCGNPVALASLEAGETVLDLGSGAGFDCFLAANKVGKSGRVMGVDMTPEMIEKARENAKKGDYGNVEFRLGEIENLPVADNSVDVVISNCVINLVPDKTRAFREAFRVLTPGGRLFVSDIVLLKELPSFIKNSIEAYVGCLSGAILREKYLEVMETAGFQDVKIIEENPFSVEYMVNDPTAKAIIENLEIPFEKVRDIENVVISMKVKGNKPTNKTKGT